MRALDRKLLRDLWAMKGQAAAIAAVMAAGLPTFRKRSAVSVLTLTRAPWPPFLSDSPSASVSC